MPLIKGKSEKAFKENIKTEMSHDKPQKQALAIAYAVKRKAQHKAKGGKIDEKLREKVQEMKMRRGPQKGVNTMLDSRSKYGAINAIKEASRGESGEYGHLSSEDRERLITRNKNFLKKKHEKILSESKEINPDLKGLAHGGPVPKEDLAHEMDESVFEEQAEHNQELHPGHGDAPATKEIADEHLGFKAQQHEDPAHMMAKGGHVSIVMHPHHIVKAIMAKKMAQGEELEPSENYLALNNSYPDTDEVEFDMLDPEVKHMAEGSVVDPDKWKEFQKGMKESHLAHGGKLKKIFSRMK